MSPLLSSLQATFKGYQFWLSDPPLPPELMRQQQRILRQTLHDLMTPPVIAEALTVLDTPMAHTRLKVAAALKLAKQPDDLTTHRAVLTRALATGSVRVQFAILGIAEKRPALLQGGFLKEVLRLTNCPHYEIDLAALRALQLTPNLSEIDSAALANIASLAKLHPSNRRDEARMLLASMAKRGHSEAQHISEQYPAKGRPISDSSVTTWG